MFGGRFLNGNEVLKQLLGTSVWGWPGLSGWLEAECYEKVPHTFFLQEDTVEVVYSLG